MKVKNFLIDLIYFLVGSLVYSLAIITFLSPNKISPGGVTGVATVLNYLFALPIGTVVFVLNIPLLTLGFFKFGKEFIFKTAIATLVVSVILDIGEIFLPRFHIDMILASVFGGSLMGLGISIIMLRGSTTGGVDIVAKLINRRYPYVSVGRIMLLVDTLVVILAAVVYKNAESGLYSIISLYSVSKIMDLMLYGADKGKIVYIISPQTQDIVYDIFGIVNRGVTIVDVIGGYRGEKRQMIMCAVRRSEVHEVYKAVRKHDNNAFIVVGEAGEIYGSGFK